MPEARTVFDAFAATAAAAPDHAFLCAPPAADRAYHPAGVEYSFGQVLGHVQAHRDRYAAAGYGHGHRVAILMENRPEFFFHYLALNALGVGVVPVNPDYRHDELAYLLDHSDADLAVSLPGRIGDLEAAARERKAPLPVVNAEDGPRACLVRVRRRARARRASTPSAGSSTPRAPRGARRAAC